MKKKSFRKGRLSERVADELERIMPQEFPNPGDPWPTEAQLATRFGVSRIVVREAVKLLEERGLVEVRAGRGTVTRTPTPERIKASLLRLFRNQPVPSLDEMERMMELRGVLEEMAAGLATARATPGDLAEMERCLSAMDEPDAGIQSQIQADLRFHMAIARAAHNRYFEMVLDPLVQVFLQQMALTDSFTLGVEQHRDIFEAIRNSKPSVAKRAVRRLMRATAVDLRRAVALLSSPATLPTAAGKRS